MNLDRQKLHLAMARSCMGAADLAVVSGLPRSTVNGAISGRSISPKTLGKIAQALNTDPVDIIQQDAANTVNHSTAFEKF